MNSKTKEFLRKIILLCSLFLVFSSQVSFADDWITEYGKYFEVHDIETEEVLFSTAMLVTEGDQYLSGDNRMYKIVEVDVENWRAYAEFINDIKLPIIDEVVLSEISLSFKNGLGLATMLAQKDNKKIGIYTTHTAESYIPSDGKHSIKGAGGVEKVAEILRANIEKLGVDATYDSTNHDPHDAGSYKRSRRTAVQMMREKQPTAIIDVHRDATPAKPYLTEINGKPTSKVRLVLGRRNQNFKSNEEMAWKIKAVADKMHPGLIKDIFYAKGNYNQDLSPRAMLVEMGTYKTSRERAEKSTVFFSEVLTTALFGGTFKEQKGAEAEAEGKAGEVAEGKERKVEPIKETSKGMGTGVIWLVLLAGGALAAFAVIRKK
ncbi:MAG: stage II sporulation protein P [Alkaliphilus sp.]